MRAKQQAKQQDADEYDEQRAGQPDAEEYDTDMLDAQHDAEEQRAMIRAVENQRILHNGVVENQNKILRMQMQEASYLSNTTRLIIDVQKTLMADLSDNQQQIKHLTEKIKEQNSRTTDLQQQIIQVWEKCRDMEEEKDAVWKKCRDLLEEKLGKT